MATENKSRKGPKQILLEPDTERLYEETEILFRRITGRKYFGYKFANMILQKGLLALREELKNVE